MDLKNKKQIVIFNSKGKKFKNNKYMHCHYIIISENIDYLYPILIFKNNEKYSTNSDLNFVISNIFTYNNDINSQYSESFSFEDLKIFSETKLLTKIKVEIFVDFLYKKKNPPKDNLEIKVTFNNVYNIEDVVEEEKKKKNYKPAVVGGVSVAGGTIFIYLLYKLYKCIT